MWSLFKLRNIHNTFRPHTILNVSPYNKMIISFTRHVLVIPANVLFYFARVSEAIFEKTDIILHLQVEYDEIEHFVIIFTDVHVHLKRTKMVCQYCLSVLKYFFVAIGKYKRQNNKWHTIKSP